MAADTKSTIDRLASVCSRHPVTFAMLFGSAARGEESARSDLDLAVEFEERVREDGYSEAYLQLRSDLAAEIGRDVDVVRIDAMSPAFAHVAFDEGIVVVGDEERKGEIEREVAGPLPSVSKSRERIAAAAARLADLRT